ncbi:MAG: hypothetical protein QCH99_10620 [Candidatus Bathyarchaeota archaeon]|nr:hypothetical protein [Candidatus Bathyarchaeum tardum]
MKANLSKTKLTRILICTLMIATILQVGAISMVQATSETIDKLATFPLPTEDFVRTTNQEVDFVKPEDGSDLGITAIAEPGELLQGREDLVETEDQLVDFVRPEDGSDLGITSIDDNGQQLLPDTEELPRNGDETSDFVKPEDGSDLGITQVGNEENSQPLIAPKTISTETPTMGAAVLLVALATIASAFVIVGHKKQNNS